MPRPERRLDPRAGPLQHFAVGLRQLRAQAGNPSYRELAAHAHYSFSVLSEAAGGNHLPTLEVTLAYVKACGGDVEEWTRRWHAVAAAVAAACQRNGPPRTAAGTAAPPAQDPPAERPAALATAAAPERARALRRPRLLVLVLVLALSVVAVGVVGLRLGVAHLRTAGTAVAAAGGAPSTPRDRPLVAGDDSRFVADVTIPDGTSVRVGERFTKVWEIQNTGRVPWRGRSLQRQGVLDAPGLCHSPERVPIPYTQPGDHVRIAVDFVAPSLPGSCRVDWKMVDAGLHLTFPNKQGLYVIVNVVE